MKVQISDTKLQIAASEGMDAFVDAFYNAIMESIDGQITQETMAVLNVQQITLLAYVILRNEVMDGGFVQLIHNGYGAFIFVNPFGKAIRKWGLDGLACLLNETRKSYKKCHEEIEKDCSDEEFMAMFERYEEFDDYDDTFVENEEQWTTMVAQYIDEHIEQFVDIIDNDE